MENKTEQFLTEAGLWNNIPNVTMSRNALAELLENYSALSQSGDEDKGTLANEITADWTSSCVCVEDDRIGETWCCNTCGKPTHVHSEKRNELNIIYACRDELLKHLFPAFQQNNYPIKAVAQATILELPALMRNRLPSPPVNVKEDRAD